MKLSRAFIIPLYVLFFIRTGTAQNIVSDSAFLQPQVKNAISFYYNAVGENAHLYNGSQFVLPDYFIKGDVFYLGQTRVKGSVFYDGVLYPDVNLSYDSYRDGLIIDRYNANYKIQLASEKVSYFYLLNHFFIYLAADSNNTGAITNGFYENLYERHVQVIAKRKTILDESITSEGLVRQFLKKDFYYIRKNNVYYSVSNQASVLKVFKDRKRELQKFLHASKIKFKNDPESAIVQLAAHYDQITNIL